jgi:hypothetical protein
MFPSGHFRNISAALAEVECIPAERIAEMMLLRPIRNASQVKPEEMPVPDRGPLL